MQTSKVIIKILFFNYLDILLTGRRSDRVTFFDRPIEEKGIEELSTVNTTEGTGPLPRLKKVGFSTPATKVT